MFSLMIKVYYWDKQKVLSFLVLSTIQLKYSDFKHSLKEIDFITEYMRPKTFENFH